MLHKPGKQAEEHSGGLPHDETLGMDSVLTSDVTHQLGTLVRHSVILSHDTMYSEQNIASGQAPPHTFPATKTRS